MTEATTPQTIAMDHLAGLLNTDQETLASFCGHLPAGTQKVTIAEADEIVAAWNRTDESGVYRKAAEDPRNPVVVHYIGTDGQTVCGKLLRLVDAHSFMRAVNFGDEDATCPECLAYALQVIEDANAENAAAQLAEDAWMYQPGAAVIALLDWAFHRRMTQLPNDLAFQAVSTAVTAEWIEQGRPEDEEMITDWIVGQITKRYQKND